MAASSLHLPLRLPPLSIPEGDVQRSGVRWLRADGQHCRAGEPIGYCNLGLHWNPLRLGQEWPFADEGRDFQAVLVPRVGGRLRHAEGLSRGGFLDQHEYNQRWSSATTLGWLEAATAAEAPDAGTVRLLLVAGRRLSEHADLRNGLLSGWYERCRAWWGEGSGFGNVLSLGICEQLGIVRGERGAFLELSELLPGPLHVAFVSDEILVPAAPVLLGQLEQSSVECTRLLDHLTETLGRAALAAGRGHQRTADDLILAGCLLKRLSRSPLLDTAHVLTAGGVEQLGPPGVVLLSLQAESAPLFRHRQLGCCLALHGFHLHQTGPALQHWLRTEFEPVQRTLDDIARDLLHLFDAVQARTGAQLLFLNCMSSTGLDDLTNYAAFDAPLGNSVAQVRHAEWNLLLYDLARQRDFSIIDVDALAVELGGRRHIPDSVHASGRLQTALRQHLAHVLRERGIPGCGSAPR